MPLTIRDILLKVAPLAPDASLKLARARLAESPELPALPVVFDRTVLGLLPRGAVDAAGARSDPDQRTRVATLMCTDPALVQTGATATREVQRLAQLGGPALSHGLVAVHKGAYAGYVPPRVLIRVIAWAHAQRTREVDLANQRAETAETTAQAREAERLRFLALLSRELRQPLQAILGGADLLQNAGLGQESRTLARQISDASTLLDRLLSDLSDLSALGLGEVPVEADAVDLKRFCNDLQTVWKSRGEAESRTLRVETCDLAAERVEVDPARLRQLLSKLISNAYRHAAEGPVTVTLSTRSQGDGPLKRLEVDVRDRGPGLPPDMRSLLETPWQTDASVPAVAAGEGMGLQVARALAARLGGRLRAEDNPGGGTVIRFQASVRAAGPRLAMARRTGPQRHAFELGRVLLVDHHPPSSLILTRALLDAGWQVDTAARLGEARDRVRRSRYQAVLTDLHLPDGPGRDLAACLRDAPGPSQDCALMAVTADRDVTLRRDALSSGYDTVLWKPVRPAELVTELADLIVRREDPASALKNVG